MRYNTKPIATVAAFLFTAACGPYPQRIDQPIALPNNANVPQVDPANFITGIRVVFPQGLVERGENLFVYYGAADVSVAGARVSKSALVEWLAAEIAQGRGGVPL